MQLPSIDIFIGLAFLVGIAYSFILKRDKTITILCSVYVGLVISSAFAQSVFNFFNGNSTIANQIWIRSNASLSTISIVLFLVCIVFVSGAINSSASRSGDVSPIEVFIYSGFTMGLIISTVLSFLPAATSQHFLDVSVVARMLKNYRTFLVVGAPLVIILLNLRKK